MGRYNAIKGHLRSICRHSEAEMVLGKTSLYRFAAKQAFVEAFVCVAVSGETDSIVGENVAV